jgi:hypothetical protein
VGVSVDPPGVRVALGVLGGPVVGVGVGVSSSSATKTISAAVTRRSPLASGPGQLGAPPGLKMTPMMLSIRSAGVQVCG